MLESLLEGFPEGPDEENNQCTPVSYRRSAIYKRGPAAGGRRPLNPATEPFRAKGTAVAKRYGGPLSSCCRSFKPFPSKLVYSRFPPGSGRLPPDPLFLQWRCFPVFSTWQTGRHRRCPKRAPRDLQEGTERSQKEPSDHQI